MQFTSVIRKIGYKMWNRLLFKCSLYARLTVYGYKNIDYHSNHLTKSGRIRFLVALEWEEHLVPRLTARWRPVQLHLAVNVRTRCRVISDCRLIDEW